MKSDSYVDGFLPAVPTANKEAGYRRLATGRQRAALQGTRRHRVRGGWATTCLEGKLTSMPMAVQRKDDETVVFSWVVWLRRGARCRMKAMDDLAAWATCRSTRLIYGGFLRAAECLARLAPPDPDESTGSINATLASCHCGKVAMEFEGDTSRKWCPATARSANARARYCGSPPRQPADCRTTPHRLLASSTSTRFGTASARPAASIPTRRGSRPKGRADAAINVRAACTTSIWPACPSSTSDGRSL